MGLPASAGAVEAALEEQVQFAELPGVGAALAAALPPTPAQLPAVATAFAAHKSSPRRNSIRMDAWTHPC